jgi:3-dehydrosphinganine reductase
VRRLAGLGARTSVIALDDEDLVRLRQSQPSATCIGADVGDRDQAQAAVSACVDAQGPCDLLFTCAGIIRPGYFMEIPDEEFERQMRVNYFGTLWPIRAVVPPMIAGRSGSIVAISSFGGLMGYSATPPTSRPDTPCARCAKHCGSNSRRTALFVVGVYPGDVGTPMLAYEKPLHPQRRMPCRGPSNRCRPKLSWTPS